MKVLIITEGGKNIGFGHITRCTSLYQAFRKEGLKPLFIVNGDRASAGILKGYDSLIFNWIKDRRRLFNIVRGADIAVIDSYLAPEGIYREIARLAKRAVYLDDNMRINYPAGIVVNGTVSAEFMKYPKNRGVKYLLGSPYMPLRKEFWKLPAKKVKNTITRILITFGGSDSRNMTFRVLKTLKEKYKNVTKRVVIGRGFGDTRGIKKLADERTNLIYIPSAAMMKRMMLDSDIAITAGGQTLYELARTGTPAVGICVAENQKRNLNAWHRAGVIEYIGRFDDKGLSSKLIKGLDRLSGRAGRTKRSRLGRHFVDGKGVERIIAGITREKKVCR